ncbi:HAD family hydrolase [Caproicibacterium amylolyticum]|jgi:Cof subfamily protein (haloacid dehalogenase superfamily)|uniref:HAD family phosphatase n=1 Tax=Caproicibacterium amylolyticum TaxID=2766537 RepID=A0A7G9WK73_9FIRM|nr:HAD family hydrolase [Caproicibacterium amylolyticum]MBE6722781.1 HAD family phosphatase [Oscillospiraceae bacterium]QNO19085.1 HAD family phosphatase [Caproicibacterium amylolyticum]
MQLKDILLVSDLDGTLIDKSYQIPQCNIDALMRFRELGGHFVMATGRTRQSAGRYVPLIQPDLPCILLNGTVLYDFGMQRPTDVLSVSPESLTVLLQSVLRKFPAAVGVELFNTNEVAILCRNRYISNTMTPEVDLPIERLVDFPQPWCKVLLGCEPQKMFALKTFLQEQPHEGLQFVFTGPEFLEIMPAGVNKGAALQKLMKQYGFCREAVFAAGDYENDKEMLQTAGFAAVPADGQPQMQQLADLVTCPCAEGAVADVVDYLVKHYG